MEPRSVVLTTRQWTKLQQRFDHLAVRLTEMGKAERANEMIAVRDAIAEGKKEPKTVAITFVPEAASAVLEMIAITGIGDNGAKDTDEPEAEPETVAAK